MEICDIPLDLPGKSGFCHIYDMIEAVHFQVDDLSALRTDKMVMSGSVRVKMVNPVVKTKTLNLADICKQGKIAVYSAETDIRIFISDIHIHRIGSRMILASHQKIFDHLSLSAVFECHLNSFKIGIITIMG